jgi:hypothetical protein
MKFLNDEEKENLEKKKDIMDFILNLMAQSGDINAIATKKLSEILELSAEIKSNDILMDNEDNMREFLSLLEQFESLLKDFADEKNIEIKGEIKL